jgi:PBP1b-binding outer membrane lipoprotein LpoB
MPKRLIAVVCAAVLLSACAGPAGPVARNDPIRETSQQLYTFDQALRQIQSLQRTITGF